MKPISTITTTQILIGIEKKKHQSGVSSTIFKWRLRDLVYPGKNYGVREILRNLIGCLEVWELEMICFFMEKCIISNANMSSSRWEQKFISFATLV